MEKLISPDFGLSFWTILIFFLLVALLSKFTWKPLIRQINERESRIKNDLDNAAKAREDAERLRKEFEEKLKAFNLEAQQMIEDIKRQAFDERDAIIKKAQLEAESIVENARREIEEMKREFERNMERRIIDVSIEISKKVLSEVLDKKIEEKIIEITFQKHKEGIKN